MKSLHIYYIITLNAGFQSESYETPAQDINIHFLYTFKEYLGLGNGNAYYEFTLEFWDTVGMLRKNKNKNMVMVLISMANPR